MIRKKFPQKKMRAVSQPEKILATASPNPDYRHYACIRDASYVVIMNNSKISFYQLDDIIPQRRVSEQYVKLSFDQSKSIKYRQYLKKGNELFYAVLFRNKKKYRIIFENLIK